MQHLLDSVPIELPPIEVQPDWLDFNGHMNIAFYLRAFDVGCEPAFDALGLGWRYAQGGEFTTFSLESRIIYLKEVFKGDPLRLSVQLLDLDEKKLHFFVRMYHGEEGYLAATHESIVIHVNFKTRKTCPFPPALHLQLAALVERHKALPWPEGTARPVGIRRRS